MLRTDVAARLVVERLSSLGALSEDSVIDWIDWRAPGRGPDIIDWAQQRGVIRRVQTDDAVLLEAIGAPRSMAA